MDKIGIPISCAGACVVGLAHEVEGKPCQDAWRLVRRIGKQNVAVASVSDGAGSALLGERGARIAAGAAASWVCNKFETAITSDVAVITRDLLTAVRAGLSTAAKRTGAKLGEFACTLLVVAVDADGRWFAAHLGDGGIVGCVDGNIVLISEPSKGEFANETFFVTDRDAPEHLKVRGWCAADRRIGSAFALFTDGLEGALVQARTGMVAPAFQRMFGWFSSHDEIAISTSLARDITEDMRRRSGDDCTLVLAVSKLFESPESMRGGQSAEAGQPELQMITHEPIVNESLATANQDNEFENPDSDSKFPVYAVDNRERFPGYQSRTIPFVVTLLGIGIVASCMCRQVKSDAGKRQQLRSHIDGRAARRNKSIGDYLLWVTVSLFSLFSIRWAVRIAARLVDGGQGASQARSRPCSGTRTSGTKEDV